MTWMFILNLCGYTDEDKEYVRVNDRPLFKKIVVVNWRPKYVDIKIQEAIPVSTDFEQITITNTKRRERRIISQEEIQQLLLLSGRISSLDESEEETNGDEGRREPSVSRAFYIKRN
jgi:hypothetical protein